MNQRRTGWREYRGAEGTEKKKGDGEGGGKEKGREREKLEVTTDICERCLKCFKPSRDLPADLPQLIAQGLRHRTKPFS